MDRDVVVVGESLIDQVRQPDGSTVEYVGGSAANVAVALARLGRSVRFATSYADDAHGRLIAAHLATAGVRLAGDPHAIARTSTALATLGPDGSARYTFDLEWRVNPVAPAADPLVAHTCSLGAVVMPGAADVVAMLAAWRDVATVTYDINMRPAITGTGADVVARVEQVVAVSDLVKASDEDLDTLYPGLDHLTAARRILAQGPAAVVVTRGGDGSIWVDAAGEVRGESRSVAVADTIGAGDTFGAALIDALWERGRLGAEQRQALRDLPRDEVAAVLRHAAHAASVTVSRPGADPPYRHELGD